MSLGNATILWRSWEHQRHAKIVGAHDFANLESTRKENGNEIFKVDKYM